MTLQNILFLHSYLVTSGKMRHLLLMTKKIVFFRLTNVFLPKKQAHKSTLYNSRSV